MKAPYWISAVVVALRVISAEALQTDIVLKAENEASWLPGVTYTQRHNTDTRVSKEKK